MFPWFGSAASMCFWWVFKEKQSRESVLVSLLASARVASRGQMSRPTSSFLLPSLRVSKLSWAQVNEAQKSRRCYVQTDWSDCRRTEQPSLSLTLSFCFPAGTSQHDTALFLWIIFHFLAQRMSVIGGAVCVWLPPPLSFQDRAYIWFYFSIIDLSRHSVC